LQAARLADAKDLAHEQPQVEAGHVESASFEDVGVISPDASDASPRLIAVSEGTLQQFAPLA